MRILYIDIDSLRHDRLGCNGYSRDTSPNIDRIAREGVILRNLYTSDAPCLPSRSAFFTGRHGSRTGVVNHGGLCADFPAQGADRGFRTTVAETTLASLLTRVGYHTVSISPFPRRHSAYQAVWGFHEMFDTGKGGLENADEMFEPAADWIRRNGKSENWFMHLNFWDPHTPYDTPREFGNPFADVAPPDWLSAKMLERQRTSYGPHSSREVPHYDDRLSARWIWGRGEIASLDDAKVHWDGYDTGVRYADHYIGKLLELLESLGILEETAIIVSGDHGENLGELNVWGDHQTADEFTCHIPGIVRWPGVTDACAGKVRDGFAYHLDLAATIVDLAGKGGRELVEKAGWDGRTLRKTLTDGAPARDEVFLSQGAWSMQRSVRWKNWLLVWTRHTGYKDFPEWMLFDLAEDPHETRNLASIWPELVSHGREKIEKWFGEQTAKCPLGDPFDVIESEGGPLHANSHGPDLGPYLARLRATGRVEAAEWLETNLGAPRPPERSIHG